MIKYFLISISLLILLFWSSVSQAEVKTKPNRNKITKSEKNNNQPESENSGDKESEFSLILSYSMPNLQLGIQHLDDRSGATKKTEEIKYVPNVNKTFSADLSYKNSGFVLNILINDSGNDPKRGKTDYSDYQFYHYLDKLGADFYFQKYSGFYMENPSSFGYTAGDSTSLRPDMKMSSYGCNFYYAFADDFSIYRAMKHAEKSGDRSSFLFMISPNYFSVKGDHSLIPASQEILYAEEQGFTNGKYTSLSASPGWAYNIVSKNNLFFTFMVFGGIGGMYKDFTVTAGEKKEFQMCIKANVKFTAGYSGDNYFCGLTGLGDGTSTQNPLASHQISLMSYVLTAELFAGMRF